MTDNDVTDDDLVALIELASEATSAFIGGDMHRYFALIEHADDYTLMSPTGGEVAGSDISERRINEMARFFRSGEGTLDVIQTYASGDLAVLVAVERQSGVVGDYPAQDWSLRVTLVFRREGSKWQLAHRHADALVHPSSSVKDARPVARPESVFAPQPPRAIDDASHQVTQSVRRVRI